MSNPKSPCCNATTSFYDGALGYESFTCDQCGNDVADHRASHLSKAIRQLDNGEPDACLASLALVLHDHGGELNAAQRKTIEQARGEVETGNVARAAILLELVSLSDGFKGPRRIIPDRQLAMIWKCGGDECSDLPSVEVSPSFYQESGTPVCGTCGNDMVYLRTELETPADESPERKLLRSIVADVEAMQDTMNNYFGPFTTWDYGRDESEIKIEWPNLAILAAQAAALLAQKGGGK